MKHKYIYILLLIMVAGGLGFYFFNRSNHNSNEGNIQNANNSSSEIEFYHCGMHPWIKSDKPGKCPICGMTLTPVYKKDIKGENGLVYIDPVMVQDIGVKTEKVERRNLSHTIRASGVVDYDETRESDITIKFPGYIEKLYADYTGKSIQKGQPLFEIYSPDLVAAQQEYLQAIKYPGSDALKQSAKQKLLLWDITESQINRLEHRGEISKTITIYSPFTGVIIEKNIVEGMAVQAGMTLIKLADLSNMWVYADVYANELGWVKPGAKVAMQLPYDAGKTLTGSVSYIYPFIQDQTRAARVRIAFSNPGDILKKDMYVSLTIMPTASVNALVIPAQAVIHSGKRDVVVLSLGEGKFKPVDVKLGTLDDGYYEVGSGLMEGDVIVTSSQFLIDSESNLQSGTSDMQSMPGMDMENKKKSESETDTSMKNMEMN